MRDQIKIILLGEKNKTQKKIKPLLSLARRWSQISTDYTAEVKDDTIWWYNERTSVSVLAGAVWQSGGIALEEASNPKIPLKKKTKKPSSGRADLMIKYRSHWFAIETKQVWVSVRGVGSFRQIKDAMISAKKDVLRVNPYHAQRIAGVFVCPWVPRSQRENSDLLIRNFIGKLKSRMGSGILAAVFPLCAREIYWEPECCYYPGTILLLRVPRS